MKLTKWHDGKVKPVHKGVYQKKSEDDDTVWYTYWDGSKFIGGYYSAISAAEFAKRNPDHIPVRKTIKWRGLATKPKSKK